MREAAVLFGKPKILVGIITDPVREKNGLGVLFLNAGLTHRIGPQRMYVRCARRLAELGYTALRFDHTGIGDSERRADNLPFPESAIQDVRDAMDFLQATRGIQRFAVAGICWGADNAIRITAADPRVLAAAAIDFYSVPSIRNLLRVYPRRVLAPSSWANLFTGRSGLFGRTFALMGIIVKSVWASVVLRRNEVEDDSLPSLPPRTVLGTLHRILDRGTHLWFVYASGCQAYDQYMIKFRRGMAEMNTAGRLRVDVLPNADHLFTLRHNQDQLCGKLVEWLEGVVAAQKRPEPATAGEPAPR